MFRLQHEMNSNNAYMNKRIVIFVAMKNKWSNNLTRGRITHSLHRGSGFFMREKLMRRSRSRAVQSAAAVALMLLLILLRTLQH